jgi:DNA-binding NarL/FixJ family response regulator
MEYLDLRVTSIDDVITNAAYRSSGCAWHTAIYRGPCSLRKRKAECPLSFPGRRGETAIAEAYERGYRLNEIAAHLGVHYATVSRRLQRMEQAN